MKKLRTKTKISGIIGLLCTLTTGFMLAGCGSSDAPAVSSRIVNGVAAVGDTLAGEVRIKDSSSTPLERATVIGSDGSYALDVTDMKAPFVLRARGIAGGEMHTLYSFAEEAGTANVNPLASAAVAAAAGVDDPAEVYEKNDPEKRRRIQSDLPMAVARILAKLRPLLIRYEAGDDDPIKGHYRADHTRLDRMFDDVKITLDDGILTITNKKTGAVIFTGKVSDIIAGHFTDDDDALPNPGSVPTAPAGVTATGGAGQTSLSWTAVGNAISYNIYWSTTTGVTKANGTKIAGATSPYLHTGLSASTAYYYIVTAVNSAGESTASTQASATTTGTSPTPSVPAAPTGVTATGGTKQTTVSWSAVSGAMSYNLYWSTTSGVTTTTGTKITGATSPAVHTGLLDGTTYYYIVTAVNGVGEGAASVQVAATTLTSTPSPTVPAAPTGVSAAGGANQTTVSWSAVSGATSYNLYWSATSGVTPGTGTKLAGVTSPYVHTGLSAGTAYYYVVTAVNGVGESAASSQAAATTNAPAPALPAAPTGVTATGGAKQVTVSWSAVSGATSYNLYWSLSSGLTIATGTKITGAMSPYVQTGLLDSTAYYYIVTALNAAGEGAASAQATATTNAPALACGTCHAIPPASGQHSFHISQGYSCGTCHGAGYSATAVNAATHANGVINLATTLSWNATNRTCSPGCHANRAW